MINPIENKPEYTRRSFTSKQEKADGNFESFSVKLNKDGKPNLTQKGRPDFYTEINTLK